MDERDALVRAFSEKREKLQELARRAREQRDRQNDSTKAHAQRRDAANMQVRGIVQEANEHRARRDALNQQVRDAKVKRDELNHAAHEKAEALHALRRERGQAPDGGSVAKLRAEIRHLEHQQQTTVLTPKKEKALVDLIAAKLKEIKARESEDHADAEMARVADEARAAKLAAEEQHAHVTQLAHDAQAAHDAMAALFRQADEVRKVADAAQAEFVQSKVEADKLHHRFVVDTSASRDLDRVLAVLSPRGGGMSQPGVSQAARAEADEIFDKFRKGEKLSTEDLMALQKAGRL